MSIQIVCPDGHSVTINESRLGSIVACPQCFATFHASADFDLGVYARAEKGRPRPSRDDDDDDDDDDEDDDEDERPAKKKAAAKPKRKRADDEDVDDDDDDDDDDENIDAPSPILWTPRKRQVQGVGNALLLYQIAFWTLFAVFMLDAVAMLSRLIALLFPDIGLIIYGLLFFVVLPSTGLLYLVQLIAWIMILIYAPPKSEAKTPALVAMACFFMPVVLLILYWILAASGTFRHEGVAENFFRMVIGGCCLFGLLSFFFSLQVLNRIAIFMKLPHVAREPVTLGWFVIGGTFLRLVGEATVLFLIYGMGFVVIGMMSFVLYSPYVLAIGMYIFTVKSTLELIKVTQKIRDAVDAYVKEG